MLERSNHLIDEAVSWLLEPDPLNPGIRYFALQHLLGRSEDDDEVQKAREMIMQTGPVPTILKSQHPEGYWARPGGGHAPSYTVTMWQIIFLAELGADPNDERVQRGCSYLLDHIVAANGGFSMNPRPTPSSVVHCLNGDPLHALMKLGFSNDARVQSAFDWQVNAITGKGDIRYYKSGTSDKGFTCAYNQKQPCAWGAVKSLKAFNAIPPDHHTSEIGRAIEVGAGFLLDQDLSKADYPYTGRINSSWFSFSFPLSFRSDILETALTLTNLGYGQDVRLENALQFILTKRDESGRWNMEKSLNGKMWADIEKKGEPSKWITLRGLLALGIYY